MLRHSDNDNGKTTSAKFFLFMVGRQANGLAPPQKTLYKPETESLHMQLLEISLEVF